MTWNRLSILLIFSTFLLGNISFLHVSQFTIGTKIYFPNSDAKNDLHNLFLACKVFHIDEGSDKECSAEIASQDRFGFIPSRTRGHGNENISSFLTIGDENSFCAITKKPESILWMINRKGEIHNVIEVASKAEEPQMASRKGFFGYLSPRQFEFLFYIFLFPAFFLICRNRVKGKSLKIFFQAQLNVVILITITLILFYVTYKFWPTLADSQWENTFDYTVFYFTPGPITLLKIILFLVWFFTALRWLIWSSLLEKGKKPPKTLASSTPSQLKTNGTILLTSLFGLVIITFMYESFYQNHKGQIIAANIKESKALMKTLMQDIPRFIKLCEASLKFEPEEN